MAKYVYSTMTSPVEYGVWAKGGGDLPSLKRTIRIEGGSNVSNKHFITPRGVLTVVSDEDFEILAKDAVFNRQMKRGFITVENKEAASVERVVSNMESQDGSAPLTPNDFDGVNGPQPELTEEGGKNLKAKNPKTKK